MSRIRIVIRLGRMYASSVLLPYRLTKAILYANSYSPCKAHKQCPCIIAVNHKYRTLPKYTRKCPINKLPCLTLYRKKVKLNQREALHIRGMKFKKT